MKKKDLIEIRGHKCECCKRTEWLDVLIPLEIHHVNPPSTKIEDLQLLCPNCHALTPNYRGKGIKTAKNISDAELLSAYETTDNIRQLLLNLGLVAKGGNYDSIRKRLISLGLTKKFNKIYGNEKICRQCGFVFITNDDIIFCSHSCANKNRNVINPQKTKIDWPSIDVLKKMVDTLGYVKTGRELGVSDTAVRKRFSRQRQTTQA